MSEKLAAGTYYIGDPCYVIKDWDSFLDKLGFNGGSYKEGHNTYAGYNLFWSHTLHGDGTYYDQTGRQFFVDAGMLSVLPVEICDSEMIRDHSDISVVQNFQSDFACFDIDGLIMFGNVMINTDGDWPDGEEIEQHWGETDAW